MINMSVSTIYVFKTNEEGTILDVIACYGYKKDVDEDRERVIKEIQESIQFRDFKDLLIIDGIKLPVIPVNKIVI
jgi:hypothetical protein